MDGCSKNKLFRFFDMNTQKNCSIWTYDTIFFINSENVASTGGKSTDTINTTTQNNGLASLFGIMRLGKFSVNSIWKLSAQMAIMSANDGRDCK